MATDIKHAEHVVPIRAKTKEAEQFLMPAYQMTLAEAKAILKRDKEFPGQIPWEQVKTAKAFIAAYETDASVTSTKPGWRRKRDLADVRK
jgi:hypothetical protein